MSNHFCFDENISPHLVELMVRMGVEGCHISKHFPSGTADPDFIPFLAKENWILVSGDIRMRKAHADILSKHQIRALFMPSIFTNAKMWEQCAWMFKHWPAIEKQVSRFIGLYHVRITDNGKLIHLNVVRD